MSDAFGDFGKLLDAVRGAERYTPQKAAELPDSGKCVIAHPNRELEAVAVAEKERCPYMLRHIVPDESSVFVINTDEIPFTSEWRR